jgi:hypothetical protein
MLRKARSLCFAGTATTHWLGGILDASLPISMRLAQRVIAHAHPEIK